MINLNTNAIGNAINSSFKVDSASMNPTAGSIGKTKASGQEEDSDFAATVKAVGNYVSKVDNLQQASDVSIKELLSGKNGDINTVISTMAQADISFKLLVGVRNKLIEAYKQTMNMSI